LNIGLTYLPLAEQTIHSLERWSQSTALNLPNFYDQILPYLDDFLRLSHDQGKIKMKNLSNLNLSII
jgi:hypothetical protein